MQKLLLSFLFSISIASQCINAYASFESGVKLMGEKNFPAAESELEDAATKGDPRAQFVLGLGLIQGKYFRKDEEQGARFLRAASEGGNGDASYALFLYLSNKDGVSLSETVRFLEKAAEQGNGQAKARVDGLKGKFGGLERAFASIERFIPIRVTPLSKGDLPKAMQNGEEVFKNTCAACHATGVANAPKLEDQQRWASLRQKGFDTLIKNSINGYKAHPPRGGAYELSGDDIRDAVVYMSAPKNGQ